MRQRVFCQTRLPFLRLVLGLMVGLAVLATAPRLLLAEDQQDLPAKLPVNEQVKVDAHATNTPSTHEAEPPPEKGEDSSSQQELRLLAVKSLYLDKAALVVTATVGLFVLTLAALGIFEWNRFTGLETKVVKAQAALEKQSNLAEDRLRNFETILKQEQESMATTVSMLENKLEIQDQKLATGQRYLEAVSGQYSSLLVGIASGFGSALGTDGQEKVGSLISEAEACFDLFQPDETQVLAALLRLEQIGAESAVPALVQIRDDESVDGTIRVRAQQVLDIIRNRLNGF